MASVFTHAAVPLLIGRTISLPDGVSKRRLALAATLCACVPDLDILTFIFDIRAWDPLGHRGFFHGLVFAAVLALAVSAIAFRGPAFRRVFVLLFLSAASHGLLDALTRGDIGVALFSPLSQARLLFPLRLIPVCPLGVSEYLSRWGAIVLGNELLLVVIPLGIGSEIVRRVRAGEPFDSLTKATVVWLMVAAVVWLRWPYLYAPAAPRVFKGYGTAGGDDDLGWINPEPLPGRRLVTKLDALMPLMNRTLAPERAPWSGGFFPAWYGGEAGRWHDGRATLALRTLFGFEPPTADAAKASLARDQALSLGPTEKYDLAHADYTFASTRHSLGVTHNARPHPRFWFGLCNGVATSAIERPEPFRAVDVKSLDGHTVRFHPLDVKALLAEAYYWESNTGVLGGACELVKFDPGRDCSMNPGGLVIGTLNYLGLAKRSFMIEVYPSMQSQNFAVASGRVDVTKGPYAPAGDERFDPGFDRARVTQLVDVELSYELSSTLLPEESGNVPASSDGTRFQKVGLHVVPFHWSATLALDAAGEIIGGLWRGDPADGPDSAAFVGGGPQLDAGTALEVHPGLQWPFIDALATASADEQGSGAAQLDVAELQQRYVVNDAGL